MEEENMDEELTESKETTEDQDGPLTDADIKELQKKAAKADEYYEQLLRTKADLENFRKRAAREREEIIQRANETLLRELFVVLDHFDLGLQTARTSESKEGVLEGLELVQKQLESFLQKLGVETIDAVGQDFDPALHEAIAHQHSELPAEKVISQVRKGYRLKGHLLRPAAVMVSKGPAAS
jgi:molecular chaperone GrpE